MFSVCIVTCGDVGACVLGSMSVSSCRCCMFMSCVHPVAVLNAAFCMTCSLLMLVEDARDDHMEEAYSRVLLSCVVACVLVLRCCECVFCISCGSKVRPINFWCVAMGSAVLFVLRSRLLFYSSGSGVNRVHVVLYEFSVILFGFVQSKTLCRYGCIYFLAALVLMCVDGMVMSSAYAGLWVVGMSAL